MGAILSKSSMTLGEGGRVTTGDGEGVGKCGVAVSVAKGVSVRERSVVVGVGVGGGGGSQEVIANAKNIIGKISWNRFILLLQDGSDRCKKYV